MIQTGSCDVCSHEVLGKTGAERCEKHYWPPPACLVVCLQGKKVNGWCIQSRCALHPATSAMPGVGITQLLHPEKGSAEDILPSTVEKTRSVSGVVIIKSVLCTCISVWFGAQEHRTYLMMTTPETDCVMKKWNIPKCLTQTLRDPY